MAKHEHEYGPASYAVLDENGDPTGDKLNWSQCRICGEAEGSKPKGAPDPVDTAAKQAAKGAA